MKKNAVLFCACILILVSLVAVPALAATVTCPSSCSCLLPAEAKKIAAPGYCQGKQAVCGYDVQKNEKYCYEKPVTIKTVPQVVITASPFVTTRPTTVALQKCEAGCTCLNTADGKVRGLAYCNGQMNVCGKDVSGAALYCYSGTVATTATTRPPAVTVSSIRVAVTTTPDASCPAECSCLTPAKAGAAGMKRCGGSSAACSADPSGRLMYCYVTNQAAEDGTAAVSTVTYPALGEIPSISVPATPGPAVPAPGGGIVSRILNFFGSLFGAPQAGVPSQLVLCNGALTNIMTDEDNCGICGNRCPGLHERYVCCRGSCTDVSYDDNNCGLCGQACPVSGTCCRGNCTDLHSDIRNCGWCDRPCNEGEDCCGGTCLHPAEGGLGNPLCLGGIVAAAIAIPLATDEDTDDSPDMAVPCDNATPCPQSGMTCCSNLCRNLNTSVGNCGSCGYACPASRYCRGGACTNESVVP